MGPIWGRQDPGGPHVDHVNLAIWVALRICFDIAIKYKFDNIVILENIPR